MIRRRTTRSRSHRRPRQGMVLVLFVVCLTGIIGLMALAIDLGLMAMARTQLADAADAAALAGARTLNGNSAVNNNYSSVLPNAQSVVESNTVLGTALPSSSLSVNIGRYAYNSTAQQFQGSFPGTAGTNYNMVQATVSSSVAANMSFSKIFNISYPTMQATATAAHRPRDVCMIMDFSGSMRFSSLMATPYYGARTASNNPDTVYPQFGPYSDTSAAGLQTTTYTSPYLLANITTTTSDGRPPICADFYTNSSGTPAWSAASAAYATTPGGDNCLKISKNTGATYAETAAQVLNLGSVTNSTRDATFESHGYAAYGMTTGLKGYTVGPGYWGKTFFIWPPDPTNDWRQTYFNWSAGSSGNPDNSQMWDSSGNWLAPNSVSGYTIDYTAILNFINNVGPQIFPSQLQSGGIVYYTQIPTSINTSVWPPTDLNQRFWKDYIDYVLGLWGTGVNQYTVLTNNSNGYTGYGSDFNWGTVQITPYSSLSGNPKPYMNYNDNPARPQQHFWFGPLSMVDFLGNYNLWYDVSPNCTDWCFWPGTCHESPMYECKLGISAALNDMYNNHASDMVSLIYFSWPAGSSTSTTGGRFNRVRVGLSQNFSAMQNSLWYSPTVVNGTATTITPYSTDMMEVPHAQGGTCYPYALMLAYNQFSSNTTLQTYNSSYPTGDAGGNGRIGAQKIIIFETDGAPTCGATANFTNSGQYNSYYNILYNSANPSGSQYPSGVIDYGDDNDPTVCSQTYAICSQLAALNTAASPGYSTTSKPLLLHCICFGPLGPLALPTLQQMQTLGNVTDGMPSYKQINGNQATVVSDLQQCIATILQDGVQISLIQ